MIAGKGSFSADGKGLPRRAMLANKQVKFTLNKTQPLGLQKINLKLIFDLHKNNVLCTCILPINYGQKVFLRVYKQTDKKALQELFFNTVHHLQAREYPPAQLHLWAPSIPNREVWARLDSVACFVVELDKQPVGFATLSEEGRIDFLYVHKDFQNRGIARALLKQLYRLARKKELLCLTAVVCASAKGFFESQGFVCTETLAKTLGDVSFFQYQMEKRLFEDASMA